MTQRSLPRRLRLLLVISSIGCLSVFFVPVNAQDLFGAAAEPEAIEETTPEEENQEDLQTPVLDFSNAITTVDPELSVAELELLLKPMTLEELQVEAAAWFDLLRQKTAELSQSELVVLKQNEQLTESQEAVKALDDASKTLDQTQDVVEEVSTSTGSPEGGDQKLEQQTEKAEDAIDKALEKVEDAAAAEAEAKSDDTTQTVISEAKDDILTQEAEEKAKIDESLPDPETTPKANATPLAEEQSEVLGKEEVSAVQDKVKEVAADIPAQVDDATQTETINETSEQLSEAADQLEEKVEEQTEVKKQVLLNATEIRDQHIAIAERFRVVLVALEKKGGDGEVYRRYVDTVNEIKVDASDSLSFWITVWGWVRSDEGGLRWSQNLLKFMGIFGGFILLAIVLGKVANRSLRMVPQMSELFRGFLVTFVRRSTLLIGVCVGLTALGVSLGPLLALVGGVSFILAFALQSNLGNFASGLMILLYKPFDIGDEIQVNEVWGYVDSISLASTKIRHRQNEDAVIVPNTTVWESTIYNYTQAENRKITIPLLIPYHQDMNAVKATLRETAQDHDLVLETPAPEPNIVSYEESGIRMLLCAWVKTSDYWQVYQDLHQHIQERFQRQGITFVGVAE